jgi:hypothetical protein
MYHEHCPKVVLLQLMGKFKMTLVKHEHEDPAVSKYFERVQVHNWKCKWLSGFV